MRPQQSRLKAKLPHSTHHALLDAALARVQDAAHEQGGSAREVAEVRARLDELRAELARAAPSEKRGRGIAAALRRNVPWAYPIVREAIVAAWPAMTGLLPD
jgi:hypothetical protein